MFFKHTMFERSVRRRWVIVFRLIDNALSSYPNPKELHGASQKTPSWRQEAPGGSRRLQEPAKKIERSNEHYVCKVLGLRCHEVQHLCAIVSERGVTARPSASPIRLPESLPGPLQCNHCQNCIRQQNPFEELPQDSR